MLPRADSVIHLYRRYAVVDMWSVGVDSWSLFSGTHLLESGTGR